jgi:hypothetical protein
VTTPIADWIRVRPEWHTGFTSVIFVSYVKVKCRLEIIFVNRQYTRESHVKHYSYLDQQYHVHWFVLVQSFHFILIL